MAEAETFDLHWLSRFGRKPLLILCGITMAIMQVWPLITVLRQSHNCTSHTHWQESIPERSTRGCS